MKIQKAPIIKIYLKNLLECEICIFIPLYMFIYFAQHRKSYEKREKPS
jgi:hypothetical protein